MLKLFSIIAYIFIMNLSITNENQKSNESKDLPNINNKSIEKNDKKLIINQKKKSKFVGSRLTDLQLDLLNNKLKTRLEIENELGEALFDIGYNSYYLFQQNIKNLFNVNNGSLYIIEIKYDEMGKKIEHNIRNKKLTTLKFDNLISHPQLYQELTYLDRLGNKLASAMRKG